VVEDLTLWHPD